MSRVLKAVNFVGSFDKHSVLQLSLFHIFFVHF
jgi:hypothetical protein